MFHSFSPFKQALLNESGSTSAQHAALLALVVTVCIGGVQSFGTAVQSYFQQSDNSFPVMSHSAGASVTSERPRGRRLTQNVPTIPLEERLRIARQQKTQRLAELRERASSRQR
ncbi:hypothetical protein GC176_09015 [bacterium]|nr:hypothetical protein [bacterium]